MSEGVNITPGVGVEIAADLIGGDWFQRIKLIHGADGTNDGDVSNTNPLPVTQRPITSGGYSSDHYVSAGSTNARNVKASAGQLYGVHLFNNAAYPIYVKFHNTAGTPTAGAGVVRTVGVQSGTQRDLVLPAGLPFATGIAMSIVKGLADADATAVLASDCICDVDFK